MGKSKSKNKSQTLATKQQPVAAPTKVETSPAPAATTVEAPKTDPVKPVVTKQPEQKKPQQKAAPKVPVIPKEPVVITAANEVKLPTSKEDLDGLNIDQLNGLTRNILSMYKEDPVEGTPQELKDLYVGPKGLAHIFIAEAAVKAISCGHSAVIKNLTPDLRKKIIGTFVSLGVIFNDPNQLELPFKEDETAMQIEASNATIDDNLKEQAIADDKEEKDEAAKIEPGKEIPVDIKGRLMKIIVKRNKEEKPFVGLSEAIEAMTMNDLLATQDEAKKEEIRKRSISDKLNSLFTIIPFNTLFIVIGRTLTDLMKEKKNPISAFFYIKNNIKMNDSKGNAVVLFTDEEIAEIVSTFVNKAIDMFDESANTKIKFFEAKIEKGEKLNDIETRNLARWKDSVAADRDVINNMLSFTKNQIAEISNKTTLIKKSESLTTDEEKAINNSNILNTQLYYSIANEIKLTGKTSDEKEILNAIHERATVIANYFRPINDKLVGTGLLKEVDESKKA